MMTRARPVPERAARHDRRLLRRASAAPTASACCRITLAVGLPDSLARRLARNGAADPAARIASRLRRRSGRRRRRLRGADQGSLRQGAGRVFQEHRGAGRPAARRSRTASFQRAGRRERGGAEARRRAAQVADHRRQRPSRSCRGCGRRCARRAGAGNFACRRGRARRPIRLAEPFEALRDQSDACLQTTGARPKAYLVGDRAGARASSPRRLHARMVRGGRRPTRLRRRGCDAGGRGRR